MSDALNRAAARGIDSYEQEIAVLREKLAQQDQQVAKQGEQIANLQAALKAKQAEETGSNGENRIADKLPVAD